MDATALQAVLHAPTTPEEFLRGIRARLRRRGARQGRSARATATFIGHHLPDLAAQTIAGADRALQGMHTLPGTGGQPAFVGDPPAWFANPVGDDEYVWTLNRMYHWPTLLAAHALSGEARYAEKVVAELGDWLRACPRPAITRADPTHAAFAEKTATPWRLLEAGIRMYETWPWVLEHLVETELLTPELLADYALAVHAHGEALAEVAPALRPEADHNTYTMECLGLLALACRFPEFRQAGAWQARALRELERCAQVQLTEDGGQMEGCPHYHNHCIYLFCLGLLLARDHGLRFSEAYTDRVRRGLAYSLHALRPSGTAVPWGDSDADHGAVTAALYGGLAFDRWGWLALASELTGSTAARRECWRHVWQLPQPEALARRLDALDALPRPALPLVTWQRTLGQVALRTDWGRAALSVFFACHTPRTNGRGPANDSHAHIDPLGFDFTALGRPLVVDPGRYTYREDVDRRAFKSAAWHNTLTVDHRDPYPYVSSWENGAQQPGDIANVYRADRLLAAEGWHRNYAPVVHRRVVALVDGRLLVVLDDVRDLAPDATVQIYYHLDADRATWEAGRRRAFTVGAETNVAIYTTENLSGELLPGRISDALDRARPSRRLCLHDRRGAGDARRYAAVILPFGAATVAPEVSALRLAVASSHTTCAFTLDGQDYALVWGEDTLEVAGQ